MDPSLKRKQHNKYTVWTSEGQTEKLYLNWLAQQLSQQTRYNVSINCDRVTQNEIVRKSARADGFQPIFYVTDYDGQDHDKSFQNTLRYLRDSVNGWSLEIELCYSNLSFELWLILHKISCGGELVKNDHYLSIINKAFNKRFESMDDFKKASGLNSCLALLTLDDVVSAIGRSEEIVKGYSKDCVTRFCGYTYIKQNPSLSIQNLIKQIVITDCKYRKKNK